MFEQAFRNIDDVLRKEAGPDLFPLGEASRQIIAWPFSSARWRGRAGMARRVVPVAGRSVRRRNESRPIHGPSRSFRPPSVAGRVGQASSLSSGRIRASKESFHHPADGFSPFIV